MPEVKGVKRTLRPMVPHNSVYLDEMRDIIMMTIEATIAWVDPDLLVKGHPGDSKDIRLSNIADNIMNKVYRRP